MEISRNFVSLKKWQPWHGRMGYVLIFQVPKLFQVVCFNDISLAPDTTSVNGFCIIAVPVPVLVTKTASVNTPFTVNGRALVWDGGHIMWTAAQLRDCRAMNGNVPLIK